MELERLTLGLIGHLTDGGQQPQGLSGLSLDSEESHLAIPPSPQAATDKVVEAMAQQEAVFKDMLVHQIERLKGPPNTHLTSLYRNRPKHDARPLPSPPTTRPRSVSVVW